MSVFVDVKHLGFVSSHLERFRKTDKFVWNFRCPYCGDSKKNRMKARGYLFLHNKNRDTLTFKCHNCGHSTLIGNLIKKLDPEQYKQYKLEKFKENQIHDHKSTEGLSLPHHENHRKPKGRPEVFQGLWKISEMDPKSKPQHYVKKRMIPNKYHSILYYTRDFKDWLRRVDPDQADRVSSDDRLIIPFFDETGNNVIAIQARSFNPNHKLRYITIKFDEIHPKIYGLDRHSKDAYTYVVEGPVDSLFLPNAIATAGSDLAFTGYCDKQNTVIVPDNEPRNREIVKFIENVIDDGWRVCIWPKWLRQKDVNDMAMAGKNFQKIIDDNTYEGLRALTMLKQWRKV